MTGSTVTASVFWAFMDKLGNKLFTFLVFLILAYKLDPIDFGIIVIARLFIDYLDMLASQGLGSAIIQSHDLTHDHLDTAFWMNFLVSGLLALLLFFLADPIAAYYEMPILAGVIPVLALAIILGGLNRSHSALMERDLAFKDLAIIGVVTSVTGGSLAIGMAFLDYGVWALVAQQLLSTSLRTILLWRFATWTPSFGFRWSLAKRLFRFGWKVMLDQQILYLSKRLDEVLVSILLGPTTLGFYSLAKRFQAVLQTVIFEPVVRVMLPVYSKLQHDPAELRKNILQHVRISGAIVFPAFLGVALITPQILTVTVGEKWLPASDTMALVMFASIFVLAPRFLKTAFVACGTPEKALQSNTIRAILLAVLIPLVSPMGLTGLGIAIIIRETMGYGVDLYLARNNPGIKPLTFVGSQIRVFLPSLVLIPICLIIPDYLPNPLLSMLAAIVLSILAYMAAAWFLNKQVLLNAIRTFPRKG